MSNGMQESFTGKHMLAIMLAFFAVVIFANMTMVYYATSSWSGLVVKNSYVASQNFNETTAELEAAKAAIGFSATYDRDVLRLKMANNAADLASVMRITVRLGRPTYEGEDLTFELNKESAGSYSAQHKLAAGVWSGEAIVALAGKPARKLPLRIIAGKPL